jgi:hypothetical protein
MNGLAPRRRRAAEFARLADLAVDRPGADVAKQLAEDDESAQLVTITQALRELEVAAGPEPEFRDRLRRRLVAHATVTAPAITAATPVVPAPRGGRTQRLAGRAGSPRLAFLAGALAALVLISGLTLLASSGAVPGDRLYGIKRSSEQLELALVHDPQDRGQRQLTFAQNRLQEIDKLVDRNRTELGPATSGSGTFGSADTDRMLAAMGDMDRNTNEGAVLISTLAVQQHSEQLLASLADWIRGQRDALTSLKTQMPNTAARRAAGSVQLLSQLNERVVQLRRVINCTCMQNPEIDPLGPKPCSPCVAQPSVPGGSGPSGTPPPGAPTGRPSSTGPDPTQTASPSGTGLPGVNAPPAVTTTGPVAPGVPTHTNGGVLPTASGVLPATPDVVCRLLGRVLCQN